MDVTPPVNHCHGIEKNISDKKLHNFCWLLRNVSGFANSYRNKYAQTVQTLFLISFSGLFSSIRSGKKKQKGLCFSN